MPVSSDRRICFRSTFYVVLSVMLLLLPVKFVFGWVIAAIFHELSHILVICLCGGEIRRITVGAGGAVIETDIIDKRKEVLCAIAGPACGFMILLFRKFFPVLAVCAAVQSLFNMLPIYPMDGGRVFVYLISKIKNPIIIDWVQTFVEWLMIAGLVFVGVRALLCGFGVMPLGIIIVFLLRKRKIPCKASQQIVQ